MRHLDDAKWFAIASPASPTDSSYVFHQCAAPAVDQTVDTSRYGNGALVLAPGSSDAADLPASTSTTIDVDNDQPTVALTGPTDALTTAGATARPMPRRPPALST